MTSHSTSPDYILIFHLFVHTVSGVPMKAQFLLLIQICGGLNLFLSCSIFLKISVFDSTVQLHEVLVCNEVMFPFPGLLGHNTNLRLLQNIIRLLLLPNLTYKRHHSKRFIKLGEHKNQYTLKNTNVTTHNLLSFFVM